MIWGLCSPGAHYSTDTNDIKGYSPLGVTISLVLILGTIFPLWPLLLVTESHIFVQILSFLNTFSIHNLHPHTSIIKALTFFFQLEHERFWKSIMVKMQYVPPSPTGCGSSPPLALSTQVWHGTCTAHVSNGSLSNNWEVNAHARCVFPVGCDWLGQRVSALEYDGVTAVAA